MTYWGEYEAYKASNPVVSPDGKWYAFQSARNNEPAGVGHGIFLYLNPRKNTPSIASAWMEMNFASWALRPRLTLVTTSINWM